MTTTIISTKKNGPGLRHGHVSTPESRAYFAWQEGRLNSGQLNQREAGKFFPATASGLTDSVAPTDSTNMLPPPDGKIASANQGDGEFLDEPGTHWKKHSVESAELLKVTWYYSAPHATRRWNYFITREGWNPNMPLSRAQFEDKPFYKVELEEQPFWSHAAALNPPNPTEHLVMLPQRSGYHVLLAVWEVANTGNAFYQVIDLDFIGDVSPTTPVAPGGLRASASTTSSITLKWNAAASAAEYRLYRNNTLIYSGDQLSFTDSGLPENTTYSYAVSSVNEAEVESAFSQPITASTSSDVNPDTPPTAPTHLHSMGTTTNSVSLMWGASSSSGKLNGYLVYRDGNEIARVNVAQLSYTDTGLQPATAYRYFVVAEDIQGQLSGPSNVLSVTTDKDEDDSGGGTYPHWILGETYHAGDIVSHNGKNWVSYVTHVAHSPDWAPGLALSLWYELI